MFEDDCLGYLIVLASLLWLFICLRKHDCYKLLWSGVFSFGRGLNAYGGPVIDFFVGERVGRGRGKIGEVNG